MWLKVTHWIKWKQAVFLLLAACAISVDSPQLICPFIQRQWVPRQVMRKWLTCSENDKKPIKCVFHVMWSLSRSFFLLPLNARWLVCEKWKIKCAQFICILLINAPARWDWRTACCDFEGEREEKNETNWWGRKGWLSFLSCLSLSFVSFHSSIHLWQQMETKHTREREEEKRKRKREVNGIRERGMVQLNHRSQGLS